MIMDRFYCLWSILVGLGMCIEIMGFLTMRAAKTFSEDKGKINTL